MCLFEHARVFSLPMKCLIYIYFGCIMPRLYPSFAGVLLSVVLPVSNAQGRLLGVLGMDFALTDLLLRMNLFFTY